MLSGALLARELVDDGALAVSVGAAIQPIVDGGQRAVRFGEAGRFADQDLEGFAGWFEPARGKVEDSQLIAHTGVAGASVEGAFADAIEVWSFGCVRARLQAGGCDRGVKIRMCFRDAFASGRM